MYTIVQKLDGTFACRVTIQDGTEYWTEKTLEAAKTAVKQAAKVLNGDKIKKREIVLYREEIPQIAQPILVRVSP